MLISTLVDALSLQIFQLVWQYMLISTLVDLHSVHLSFLVWQYMLISTLVDYLIGILFPLSDSIC